MQRITNSSILLCNELLAEVYYYATNYKQKYITMQQITSRSILLCNKL